jgi:hypothetical protein
VKSKLLYAFLVMSVGAGCGVDKIEDGGDNPGVDGGGGGGGDGGGTVQDNRVTDQLQLLYRFDGVAGQTTVADTSGVGDPLDLTIADPAQVTWDAGGMTFIGPTVAQNPNPMTKITTGCMASNTVSVEAWVKNAGIEGSGRIISTGLGTDSHNFALKQQNDYYQFRLRTSQNQPNGDENYLADSPVGTLTAVEQHIVVTRSSVGVTNFYIDGLKQSPDSVPGNFGTWDLTYGLYVGNESTYAVPDQTRPWLGTIYLAAVYCKELSQAEISQNMAEGY